MYVSALLWVADTDTALEQRSWRLISYLFVGDFRLSRYRCAVSTAMFTLVIRVFRYAAVYQMRCAHPASAWNKLGSANSSGRS